jgi:predicted amidohydrolase YtcJ
MLARSIFVFAATGAYLFGGPLIAQDVADRIFLGGPILTMEDGAPRAEALAVKDGVILAVGSEDEVMSHRGDGTLVTDLGGHALLPGFLDAHSHYINALLVANQAMVYAPPVGPGADVESIIAALEAFADERGIPPGEMITAYGYDDTVMPDGRLLNRDDLEAAFPDNPVRVDHVSMHGGVLNTPALELFGFDAETETPPGGIIVRETGTNKPYGLIMETAFLPVFEGTPTMTPKEEVAATRAGQMLFAEAGITTAHEGATHLAHL